MRSGRPDLFCASHLRVLGGWIKAHAGAPPRRTSVPVGRGELRAAHTVQVWHSSLTCGYLLL